MLPPIDHGADPTDRPRVLVVDDDSRSREILAAYLGASHAVLEAADGQSALDLFDRRVDLVLLDVMMPGMNGYDVCREVKRRTANDCLPVLLLTAANAQEDRNSGLAAGADDFLTKPVDRQELLLRMRLFLRLQRQERIISRQLQELERLQHMKDDLVSLVVHDARTPLQNILTGLAIVGDQLGAEEGGRAGELRSRDAPQRAHLLRSLSLGESPRAPRDRGRAGGALVLGPTENLPPSVSARFAPCPGLPARLNVFRREAPRDAPGVRSGLAERRAQAEADRTPGCACARDRTLGG